MSRDTIFLVDDHEGFRHSTQWLLESRDLAVHAFSDAPAFLAGYVAPRVASGRECLLLDVRMPQMTGLQLLELLRARGLHIPVIMMTAHGDVPLAVAAMRHGAIDFLEKPFSEETVLAALRAAFQGGSHASGPVGTDVELRARIHSLTTRERQVHARVVDGKLNKTIADELGISMKTVELHRRRVMEKMRARSVAELVRLTLSACAQD